LHSLKPNDTLIMLRGVPPGYAWKPNQHKHVALIAGGAGITPMYQLIRGILSNPEDQTRITLVWGVNTDADLFLSSELAGLQERFPGRLRTIYAVSRPAPGSPHHSGYVTRQLLEESGLRAGKSGDSGNDTKVLVCGPPPMEKALTASSGLGSPKGGILAELGYSTKQIYKF
jgi:cytochrome-b5 reductase